MKPSINQALVNQFNGFYKGSGLLGLSALSVFITSLLESDGTSSISSILSVIVMISFIIGAAGYFFSSVLDFETIEGYANKKNRKKPSWRDDEFLLRCHQKAIEIAGIFIIGFLFVLWQLVGLNIDINTAFTTRQFCSLTGGLFMTLYSALVWHQLKDDK
jgi:hypothetical protein